MTVAAPPPTPSSTVSRPGGLVGAIDAARVAAVCANADAAQTAIAGSLGGSAGTDALLAAAGLLERPPVDPSAAAAGATIRAQLLSGHADAAVSTALAFCHAHRG